MQHQDDHSANLMRFPIFHGVSGDILASIHRQLHLKHIMKGRTLYDICQAPDCVYFLAKGKIRLTYPSKEGKSPLIYIVGENSILGELEAVQNLPRLAHASAMEDSELLTLKREVFVKIYSNNQALANNVVELFSSNLSRLLEAYNRAINQSVESKLAGLLTQFHTRFREPSATAGCSTIPLHLPHDELAEMIGTTRTTIHKLMSAWKSEGILEFHYGKIRILKPERLNQARGGNQDSALN